MGRACFAVLLVVALGGRGMAQDCPQITTHPEDQTVCTGGTISLSVVATGDNLTYQWRKNDEDVSGATTPELLIESAVAGDSGNYDCVVDNGCSSGAVTTNAASVLVADGPQITQQPVDTSVCTGAPLTLSVSVAAGGGSDVATIGTSSGAGTGPRMRGNFYTVVTGTTLTRIEHYLNQTSIGDVSFFVYESTGGGPYNLIFDETITPASGGERFYSSSALAVPLVAGRGYLIGAAWDGTHGYYWGGGHPQPTGFGESTAGFSAGFQDPLPNTAPANTSSFVYHQRISTAQFGATYQWRKEGVALPEQVGATLQIAAAGLDDAGSYDCEITSGCGTATSDSATVTVSAGPVFDTQPQTQSGCAGEAVTLTTVVSGDPPLTYQWQKDGEDLGGETLPELTLDQLTTDDAGDYVCIASNDCGSVLSDPATLTIVDGPPALTADPNDVTVCVGEPITLSVAADGDGLAYQWRHNDEEIVDATADTLSIAAAELIDAGGYDCIVSNGCGQVVSGAALVTVGESVVITEQPAGTAVCDGAAVTLSVSTDALSAVDYQWQKDGTPIDGATGPDLVFASTTAEDSGAYRCEVSTSCTTVLSDVAVLAVQATPVIVSGPGDAIGCVDLPLTLSVDASGGAALSAEDVVGETGSMSSGPRIRGNVYELDQPTTLTEIAHYLEVTASGSLTFFVYESSAESGPFALVHQNSVTASPAGPGYYASGPLSVNLAAGQYYLIGCAWSGGHDYYWGGTHPIETSFGRSVAGYASVYQSPLPAGPVPNSGLAWAQRLRTTTAPLNYEWYFDGNLLVGETGPQLRIDPVTAADAGTYWVLVANGCGSVVSPLATVTVEPCVAPPAGSGVGEGPADGSVPGSQQQVSQPPRPTP